MRESFRSEASIAESSIRPETIREQLRQSPFIEERPDGRFAIAKRWYHALNNKRNNYASSYNVPSEYPRTELFLIALLGKHQENFLSFLQQVETPTNSDALKNHDEGRGLPEGILPPLLGKKILFVGGGTTGKVLLGRYVSTGALAVNIDPNVSQYAESTYRPASYTGSALERRDFFDATKADELRKIFGAFDAIVIQNVFDFGAVDSVEGAKKIMEGLLHVLSDQGLVMLQIDQVHTQTKQVIVNTLEREFLSSAMLDTFDGQRGTCGIYLKRKHSA
jgi:hypothetical protein